MTDKQVFMVAVGELTPDPNQPRKTFNQEDVESMASTIEAQGVINPIEIDGDNVIVTGQLRWMAAEKAGLSEVPCIVWEGDAGERFERQVVENLNHHELSEEERGNAIVKLWETRDENGERTYPSMAHLGKSVGYSRSRISRIIGTEKFKDENPDVASGNVSVASIIMTEGLKPETRVKILGAIAEEKIGYRELEKVKKIAQVSDTLLDKTLEGNISLERATETADAIREIEEETVLTDAQKDRYVKRIEQDEGTLRQYKDDVRERVKQVMTAKPSERVAPQAPVGRDSPVDKFTAVRDEVRNLMSYLGYCDTDERAWAKRVLIEIRDEVDKLIETIGD